ncbi:MAG: prepilin-type N-terminal cleavage/methylation domain-containing protein [Phycisphaerae bacterium]|nr:prepilin-type N-terminal cleavage/methylation domain-containing protein [Phycisphaerae bacterium]
MRTKKGFTLIELLVVIAIIALLLAILIPALGKAKVIAQEVLCKSNMKQYFLVTELYANEYDDRLPPAWHSIYKYTDTSTGCRWHDEANGIALNPEKAGPYWPYLASSKASVCSTFENFARQFHSCSIPIKVQFSYSMNGFITGRDQKGIKKAQIKSSPSETFLWSEENMWKMKEADGTILSNYVLNDNALLVGNAIDSFGSFHKVSKAKFSLQLPPTKGGFGVYNTGSVNALLLDGSNIVVTPQDSNKYRGRSKL